MIFRLSKVAFSPVRSRLAETWPHNKAHEPIWRRSWHAHVPVKRLGIPSNFRITAARSRACRRDEGTGFLFDFTGMAPLPPDNLERRLIILLDEVDGLRRHHPEIFDRLGVDVKVFFKEESEQD